MGTTAAMRSGRDQIGTRRGSPHRVRRWLRARWVSRGIASVLGLLLLASLVHPTAAQQDGDDASQQPIFMEAEREWFVIGSSVQGRSIEAVRLGAGPVALALMGSIHGGWERNTETLVMTAYRYFNDHPEEIPPELTVYFIPTTNPDGLAAGELSGDDSDSAWNARGIDLNRNFDSGNWSPDTYGRIGGRYGPTGTRVGAGGTAPFSEPETQAIRDFVLSRDIAAVMSYHSGIVSVTSMDGGGGIAEDLAIVVADITGYPYLAEWTEYLLTGQFMDWLEVVGVKGLEIELPTRESLDWEQNLAAIQWVMDMLAAGED
jgi:hypothetical protein